jgi:hypothetical protein
VSTTKRGRFLPSIAATDGPRRLCGIKGENENEHIVITSQVLFHNGSLLHYKVQYTTLDNSSQLF